MKKLSLILIFVLFVLNTYAQVELARAEGSYKGIANLKVQGSFCSVEILGKERDQLDFNGRITSKTNQSGFEIRHERKGNTLKVWLEQPKNSSNVNGELNFTVPPGTVIEVENVSGSVVVKNITAEESNIKTVSGSIHIQNIESTASISSVSGSCKLMDFAGSFKINTTSGSQDIKRGAGILNCSLISGSIKVEGYKGEIKASSTSGSVDIQDSGGTVRLSSVSGSINGKNVKLDSDAEFTTSSGSINMKLLNAPEDLSYELSSVSGTISVRNSKVSGKYVATGGPILIKGKTTSGSQKYL